MPDILDQSYLEHEQYKDASQLNARIYLHQRFSTNPYGWFKWVFDQLDLPSIARILEIGCGPGTLWSTNLKRIPPGWVIVLSDFSPGMITEARGNQITRQRKFFYQASNGMAIPFENEIFDAVIANHMLYHIPDLPKALGEINRVLKPGGHFFATTNGHNHLRELDELMDRYLNFGNKHYSTSFSSGGFTLDNGLQQLSPWFTQIRICKYEDGLDVDDAGALVAYMLSMVPQDERPADMDYVTDITSAINQIINDRGSIYIQKSIGMFICQKAEAN